ncbi:MAG: cation-translocating P-type ATPase, partial [Isosphaeraceae bacterium]
VETLGSVTVICSDKTGTLTRNEMTVREIRTAGGRYQVTGSGYSPTGEFLREGSDAVDPGGEPELARALKIAAWCNNAKVIPKGQGDEGWQVIGDPTEGALIVAALKADMEASAPDEHVILEIPFDSDRKTMSVIVREPDGSALMLTKGAPEILLRSCDREWRDGTEVPLTDDRRREIMAENSEMAGRALRVLALAERRFPNADDGKFEEKDLSFTGLVGMIDPPRDEAREAVARCRQAGIRPVMITGDHHETALAIAHELGLAAEEEMALTGARLDETTDDELGELVTRVPVYARVSAEHKLRVVRAWKRRGDVVAMTGDGVNDAPAVDAADIGIAMGITGTDVTKEASDMVLTDDNFASIVNAVEEGRGIFDNIQKFVLFLLSCNAGEVLVMLFAAVIGWPAPLTALQILWVNLVTDSLPALALGMEPPEPDVMTRPPRPPQEPVITWSRGLTILFNGTLVAIVTGIAFGMIYQPGDAESLAHARATSLMVLAFSQLFFAFGCRSQRYTLPQLGLFTNPWMFAAVATSGMLQASLILLPVTRSVFDLTPYPAQEWFLVMLLSLVPVTVVELGKIVRSIVWGERTSRPG